MAIPRLIELPKIGSPALGYITVAENSTLPFIIQRVYWTYFTPDLVERGQHAHRELEQIVFATSGRIEFALEGLDSQVQVFVLDSPNIGLYIPCGYWRTIKFSHNAVLMCLASMEYNEQEYIRNYSDFKALATHKYDAQ